MIPIYAPTFNFGFVTQFWFIFHLKSDTSTGPVNLILISILNHAVFWVEKPTTKDEQD